MTAHLFRSRGILLDIAERSARSCSEAMHNVLSDPPHYISRAAAHERTPTLLDDYLRDAVERDSLAMGWAYQFWNEAERDMATTAISRRGEGLTHHNEVAVATQLFTEEYMATFLIERCLAEDGEGTSTTMEESGDILDPACGVGHMLVPFLRALLTKGRDRSAEQTCSGDVLSRLYGCDIDHTAVEICRVILFAEAQTTPTLDTKALWSILCSHIQHLPSPWGTLDREESSALLHRVYGYVITNPPYIGRRKLNEETRAFLDRHYPATSMDLCAAFMERCLELTRDGGLLALVTVDKWLRLKGYEALRIGGKGFAGLYRSLSLDTVCELGHRAFSSASGLHDGVGVCLLSARKNPPVAEHTFLFLSTTDELSMTGKARALREWQEGERPRIEQAALLGDGQSSSFILHHRMPSSLTSSKQTVRDIAQVVVGLQTSDDRRFVRYVWSVPPDRTRWIVHNKGGGYDRWFGLNQHVLDWGEGRPLFEADPRSGIGVKTWFESEGWTYTWFANGALGLRKKEPGWSFGRAASSGVFCEDSRCVAFLNSRVASLLVRRLGGKAQLPEGIVRSLPIPRSFDGIDPRLVDAAVFLKRALVEHDPTDASFSPRPVWDPREQLSVQALLLVVEGILERQVCDVLELNDAGRREIDDTMGMPVGWHGRRISPQDDDIWNFLPPSVQFLRSLVEPWVERNERRFEGVAECANYFESPKKISSRGRPLPVTSLVESISRSTGLHPFDVASDVMSLIGAQRSVAERVIAPPLFSRIVALALTELGHQWWGDSDHYRVGEYEELPARELTERVERVLPMVVRVSDEMRNELLGGSLMEWMISKMPGMQLRMFSQTPLLNWREGRSLGTGSFRHVWSVDDRINGCDRPEILEPRSP
jgi:hypothetical protein